MFAFTPVGGSFVAFKHIYTIPGITAATAGSAAGSAEMKSRKSGCALSLQYSSIIFSNFAYHFFIRWMFYSNTQPPVFDMLTMLFSAFRSWP